VGVWRRFRLKQCSGTQVFNPPNGGKFCNSVVKSNPQNPIRSFPLCKVTIYLTSVSRVPVQSRKMPSLVWKRRKTPPPRVIACYHRMVSVVFFIEGYISDYSQTMGILGSKQRRPRTLPPLKIWSLCPLQRCSSWCSIVRSF
jgi:hypothetical protein